jgi:gamma-glutamyltranspeptidase/glutathione hydrolase
MWHVDHFPASFWPHALKLNQLVVESRFTAADVQALKDRGHDVRLGEPWSEGRLCVSTRERDSQGRLILRSAASPRGMQAFAVGR